jgi:hypothetical protein
VELVSGFGLYYKLLINDHIQSLLGEVVALITHPHGDLARDAMLTRDKLPLQSHQVDMLEKSKTERVIYVEERPDH